MSDFGGSNYRETRPVSSRLEGVGQRGYESLGHAVQGHLDITAPQRSRGIKQSPYRSEVLTAKYHRRN
jgi:hypothetical protein